MCRERASAPQRARASGRLRAGRLVRRTPDEGTVTASVAILATAFLLMVALIVNGGRLLNRYVQAHELAGSAARAAAQEVDLDLLYAGGDPQIVAHQASAAVDEFVVEAGVDGSFSIVSITTDQVTVQVSLNQTLLGSAVAQTVTAQATATLQHGVEAPR